MILAVKCMPDEYLLNQALKAGMKAVELYLSKDLLADVSKTIRICSKFPFRYAIHAPNNCLETEKLSLIAKELRAEIIIFHNIYWEDEWSEIIRKFNGISTRLCLENTHSSLEPLKFTRRYGIGRCLDLEHLQVECAGVFEEVFVSLIKEAIHVHLTGYKFGSSLWHTHIHSSPEHNRYILGLLKKADYSGFIVSEARSCFQAYEDFRKLREFYESWLKDYKSVDKGLKEVIKKHAV